MQLLKKRDEKKSLRNEERERTMTVEIRRQRVGTSIIVRHGGTEKSIQPNGTAGTRSTARRLQKVKGRRTSSRRKKNKSRNQRGKQKEGPRTETEEEVAERRRISRTKKEQKKEPIAECRTKKK